MVCGKLNLRPALVSMKRSLHQFAREPGFVREFSELKVCVHGSHSCTCMCMHVWDIPLDVQCTCRPHHSDMWQICPMVLPEA